MNHFIAVEPRDNVVARDGRPFGQGSGRRMRTHPFPFPQLPAGSLRTLVGKETDSAFDAEGIAHLLNITAHGPLLEQTDNGHPGRLWFATPQDLVYDKSNSRVHALNPAKPIATTESPTNSDLAFLPASAGEFKPDALPAFLSLELMTKWLATRQIQITDEITSGSDPVVEETRTHVAIQSTSGASADSLLFTTAGLRFAPGFRMSLNVAAELPVLSRALATLDHCHPMGGERRLAFWTTLPKAPRGWSCPKEITDALKVTPNRLVRLVLATPALFDGGFMPGWLKSGGPVPGTGVKLKFVAAAVNRWQAVSGWSYDRRSFGPKAIRRLAPAGSVYFCEHAGGDSIDKLSESWLKSISDDPQDRRDGFGLALWGTWSA